MSTPADLEGFQAALAAARVARVVIGSSYDSRRRRNNSVLAVEESPAEVSRLVSALEVDPTGQRMDWMTSGGPTIAFYDDRAGRGELLAVVTCIGQDYIRSPLLEGDAPLLDGGLGLAAWLAARGLPV